MVWVYAKINLTSDLRIFQNCQYLGGGGKPTGTINHSDSHLSTGQCATLSVCASSSVLSLYLELFLFVPLPYYSSIVMSDEPSHHEHGIDSCHLPVLELH